MYLTFHNVYWTPVFQKGTQTWYKDVEINFVISIAVLNSELSYFSE